MIDKKEQIDGRLLEDFLYGKKIDYALFVRKLKEHPEWEEYLHSLDKTHKLEFQKDVVWQNILESLDGEIYADYTKSHKRGIKMFFKYAAIIFLPLCALAIYINNTGDNVKDNGNDNVITEHQMAVVKFDNGKTIDLSKLTKDSVFFVDSVKLRLDSSGTLSYVESNSNVGIMNSIFVPRGGEYIIQLSDGTKVYLNSETLLKYPICFGDGVRKVYLEGEAYFDVTQSDTQRFVVCTKNSETMVLGTEFNLKSYDEDGVEQTTLVKGKIRYIVNGGDGRVYDMKPNEQVSLDIENKHAVCKNVNIEPVVAWKNNQFLFVEDRLEDIMTVLSRWYGFKVIYSDETLKNIRFSGRLDRMDDVKSIIDIIQSMNKFTIRCDNGLVTITR